MLSALIPRSAWPSDGSACIARGDSCALHYYVVICMARCALSLYKFVRSLEVRCGLMRAIT
jgi:hypothetical protein